MNRCCRCLAIGEPMESTDEQFYPWRMRCVDWTACNARHNASLDALVDFLRGVRAA